MAAKRRAVQQGFMEHFLHRISSIDYAVVQDMDILNENCAEISNLDLEQLDGFKSGTDPTATKVAATLNSASDRIGLNSTEVLALAEGGDFEKCQVLPKYDFIERQDSTNGLVENTIKLAANVTELQETHHDLLHGKGQVLKLTMNLLGTIVN